MPRIVEFSLVLVAAAAGIAFWQARNPSQDNAPNAQDVQDALVRLYDRASYYGALENSPETTKTLWPVAVVPAWFTHPIPANPLLSGVDPDDPIGDESTRPWIDIAPPGDQGVHPPDPVAIRSEQAQFWYNPNTGVFRARVSHTELDVITAYNRLNGVELSELHRDSDPQRVPLAYTPGKTPNAASLASPSRSAGDPAYATADRFTFTPATAPQASKAAGETVTRPAATPDAASKPSLFNPEPTPLYPELQEQAAEPPPAEAGPPRPIGGRARFKK